MFTQKAPQSIDMLYSIKFKLYQNTFYKNNVESSKIGVNCSLLRVRISPTSIIRWCSFGWLFFMCTSMCFLRPYGRWHTLHENLRSPKWNDSIWSFNFEYVKNLRPQLKHVFNPSFVWTSFMWLFKFPFSLKVAPQRSHANGLFAECILLVCFVKSYCCRNSIVHPGKLH